MYVWMSGKGTQTDSCVSMRHSCQKTWESTVENGQQAKLRPRSSFSFKKKENRKTSKSVHWWLSHQRPVRVGLHCQARCDYHPWRQCSLTSGSLLGRSEVLRNLRHYLRAQSQGYHTTDRLEERSVERGSARRSSLKGRETTIVNQANTGTVSKATLGEPLRDGVERIIVWAFPSALIPFWTELNWYGHVIATTRLDCTGLHITILLITILSITIIMVYHFMCSFFVFLNGST